MIAPNAFKGNKTLKTVTLGKYIRTIGKKAFASCPKLTTVKGGAGAFKGIHKKASVKVLAKVLKTYTELLPKKGLPKTVKVKK